MDIFVSLIICHRLFLRHNVLTEKANEHNVYSLIDSVSASQLLIKTKDIVRKNIYRPFLYCSLDVCGQLQTTIQFATRNIATFYILWMGEINYDREIITTKDGAQVALDWAYSSKSKRTQRLQALNKPCQIDRDSLSEDSRMPTIVLHHGLCGDSSSEHIVLLAKKFLSCKHTKFRVVVVVMRGCGGTELISSSTMDGSITGDLRVAVDYIHNRLPNSRLFGIGFSLGAAVMLKYLGEEASATALEAAVCVSPPWDGRNKGPYFSLWSIFLALPVKLYALRHRKMLDKRLNLMSILTASNLCQLDSMLAQFRGFEGVHEYYTSCSPVPLAANIRIPTLAMSAMDDPVCFHGSAPEPLSLLQEGSPTLQPLIYSDKDDVSVTEGPMVVRLKEDDAHDFKHMNSYSSISKCDVHVRTDINHLSVSDSNNNNNNNNNNSSISSSMSEDNPCGLLILKTLLGGHLAFPSFPSYEEDDPYFSLSATSILHLFCNSWSDDVTFDWILSFLTPPAETYPVLLSLK